MNIDSLDLLNDLKDDQYLLVDGPDGPNRLAALALKSLLAAVQATAGDIAIDGIVNAKQFVTDVASKNYSKTQESDFTNLGANVEWRDGGLYNKAELGDDVSLATAGASCTLGTDWTGGASFQTDGALWTIQTSGHNTYNLGGPIVSPNITTTNITLNLASEKSVGGLKVRAQGNGAIIGGSWIAITPDQIIIEGSDDSGSTYSHDLGTFDFQAYQSDVITAGSVFEYLFPFSVVGLTNVRYRFVVTSELADPAPYANVVSISETDIYEAVAYDVDNDSEARVFDEGPAILSTQSLIIKNPSLTKLVEGEATVDYSIDGADYTGTQMTLSEFAELGNISVSSTLDLKLVQVGANGIAQVHISTPSSGGYFKEEGIFVVEINGAEVMRIEGGNLHVGGILTLTESTPSSATDTGEEGTVATDDDYIYVCTSPNTWKRAALASW